MGARNMSELGTGLAGLAERKQARADALLEGQAQQDYYRASAVSYTHLTLPTTPYV